MAKLLGILIDEEWNDQVDQILKKINSDLNILRGGVNRFLIVGFHRNNCLDFGSGWRIVYTDLRILLIQWIADLSNILARIVDLACNLVRILDCDFIVELLADSNLDKTIVGPRILLQIWIDRRICIHLFTPPPPLRRLRGMYIIETFFYQKMFAIFLSIIQPHLSLLYTSAVS